MTVLNKDDAKRGLAFERERIAVLARTLGLGGDPAGEDDEREHLRAMGKWRFILVRGVLGFSVPMFFWILLSDFRQDLYSAKSMHEPVLRYLLQSWSFGFIICSFIGLFVGLLAWRRITSEVWPGSNPDPESTMTRLGPLS